MRNATESLPTLSSMYLARSPKIARRPVRFLTAILLGLPLVLVFMPWTQTVHGTGRAIAFNPVQRQQFIVCPIEGRVKKWYVVEGDRVVAGQRIVELVDNDPNLEQKLLDEERAILDRLRAEEGRVRDIEARIRNLENSRELAIAVQTSILRAEQARVRATEQELEEARALVAAAEPNFRRQKDLLESKLGGLASQRDFEVAQQALLTAQAKFKASEARIALVNASERAAADNLKKIESDTAAMINLESASKRSAEAAVSSVLRDKAQIEVRVARQRAQYVDAPCKGTVYRLLANAEEGGILVRPGERLAIIVPDIEVNQLSGERVAALQAAVITLSPSVVGGNLGAAACQLWPLHQLAEDNWTLTTNTYPGIVAELFVDGNDQPLLRKGDAVRLQFEGWPAVQFVGWPSVAVGTFGGRVYLIDPTTNDKGQFRILVEPDPEDEPWPQQDYLRQGVRCQGWVLLNRVSVGWELWRNLNGFPPFREIKAPKPEQSFGPVKLKGLK
jgi:multidrug efflux pump subunit AcrA (membrane-fusion protein)